MKNNSNIGMGLVVALAGTVYLTVSAMVAECRRHKAAVELRDTKVKLILARLDNIAKDMEIEKLNKELLKTDC